MTWSLWLSDRYVFPAFQLALAAFLVHVIISDVRTRWFPPHRGEASALTRRGEQPRAKLTAAYAGVSLVLLAVNGMAEALEGYKTAITLADLLALVYVVYLSPWGRDRAIRLLGWWENKPERR